MMKIRFFAEITPNLPFSEFYCYELYREAFEKCELGKKKKILPLPEDEFEVIVENDATKDETGEIVAGYGKSHENLLKCIKPGVFSRAHGKSQKAIPNDRQPFGRMGKWKQSGECSEQQQSLRRCVLVTSLATYKTFEMLP